MRRAAPALVLLLAAVSASAQTATSLVGRVADPSGQPIVGAAVAARHLESGLVREATTDSAGAFTLAALENKIHGKFIVDTVNTGTRTQQGEMKTPGRKSPAASG